MVDPEVILVPLGITLIMLSIGGMVAIIKWANYAFDPRRGVQSRAARQRLGAGATQDERLKALEVYRQLASEKLDAVKTAIAMGYSDKELEQLDKRLEQLIGAEALKGVIRGELPLPGRELGQPEYEAELRTLRETQ